MFNFRNISSIRYSALDFTERGWYNLRNDKEHRKMKIRHDIHTHTLFSTCCEDPEATMAAFVREAHELGHKVIGISNHLWDEKVSGASYWYFLQPIKYGLEAKYAIPADTKGVKVLFGIESEFCGMSDTLGLLAETAKQFDYVLIPHSHTHMKNFVIPDDSDVKAARETVRERLAAAFPELSSDLIGRMSGCLGRVDLIPSIKQPEIDYAQYLADFMHDSFDKLLAHPEFVKLSNTVPTLVAHPFAVCGESTEISQASKRKLDRDRLFEQFRKAAKMNVAMDVNISAYTPINGSYENDEMVKVMRIARDAGCKFAFGTDSHSVAGLKEIRHGDELSEIIGITENDLIDIVKA